MHRQTTREDNRKEGSTVFESATKEMSSLLQAMMLELEGFIQRGKVHLHDGSKPEPAGGTEERWSQ